VGRARSRHTRRGGVRTLRPGRRPARPADSIHDEVCTRGFNRELGSFVQSYDSTELDASLLLPPTTRFLPPDDARVRGTIEAIERRLFVDGFVLRYDTARGDDGLPPEEGAFPACSFCLADAWLLLGRAEDARALSRASWRCATTCNEASC
jgi:GH15 family glucan-1,4-alpha-glucosidase